MENWTVQVTVTLTEEQDELVSRLQLDLKEPGKRMPSKANIVAMFIEKGIVAMKGEKG